MAVALLPALLMSTVTSAAQYGLQRLIGSKQKLAPVDRGKLDDIRFTGNGYGEFIPRGYGVFRVAGSLIDATEIVHTTSTTPGRSGGKGAPKPPTPTEIHHVYTTTLAIAVCEGLGALGSNLKITRIWEGVNLIFDTTVTNQGDNQYEAERAGNTLSGGATVVTDATASSGESVRLPTNGSCQFNGVFGTGVGAILEFVFKSTAANSIEMDWNGTVFGDSVINSNSEWAIERSNSFVLNSGFTNTLKIKNLGAADLHVDYLTVRISGQATGGVNPNLIQTVNDATNSLAFTGFFPERDGTGSTSGVLAAGGNVNFTVYTGTETQTPNSALVALRGAANTPAYRGTAYVVFDSFQLKEPILPSFSFEVDTGVFDLDDIITDLYAQAGIISANLDVTALSGDLFDTDEGFVITSREDAGKWINDLQTLFQFDMVEVDGKVKAVKRNGSSVATITSDELRGHWLEETPPDLECLITDEDVALLPQFFGVGALDALLDYHNNIQTAQLLSGGSKGRENINLPMILDAANAKQLAEILLYKRHLEARSIVFRTGPKYQKLHPNDIVTLSLTNATHTVRIVDQRITFMGPQEFEGVRSLASIYNQLAPGSTGTGFEAPVIPFPSNTKGIIIDGPLLRAEDAGDGTQPVVYIAAGVQGSGTWTGAFLLQEFPLDSGSYQFVTAIDTPAGIGVTAGTLASVSDPSVWDRTNSLIINFLTNTTLSSATEQDVLANPELNLLGIINPSTNAVEYVQFATATPGSPTAPYQTRYTISTFLRGRIGSDANVGSHTSADDVVVIDGAVRPRRMSLSDIGRSLRFKFPSSGQALDQILSVTQTLRGNSLLPLAPSNVRGRRDAQGNLLIEWTRRARLGAGLRSSTDVPLAEEDENYEIDILDGANVVRTIKHTGHQNDPALLVGTVSPNLISGNSLITASANDTANAFTLQQIDHSGAWIEARLVSQGGAFATVGLIEPQFASRFGFELPDTLFRSTAQFTATNSPAGIAVIEDELGVAGVSTIKFQSGSLGPTTAVRLRLMVVGSKVLYFWDYTDEGSVPFYTSDFVAPLPLVGIVSVVGHPAKVENITVGSLVNPSVVYRIEEIEADFGGSAPATVTVDVCQVSAVVGRGPKTRAVL